MCLLFFIVVVVSLDTMQVNDSVVSDRTNHFHAQSNQCSVYTESGMFSTKRSNITGMYTGNHR